MSIRRIALPLALVLLPNGPVSGQPVARTIFDQLPAVAVHVVGVNPAIDSVGIDSTPMRAGLESRLQLEGIEIADPDYLLANQEIPRLVVQIVGFPVDSAFFYAVTLELLEPVRLERNGLKVFGYGWSKQVVGVAVRAEVRSAVEQAVDHLAGLFFENRRRALSVARR
jgi:hypothetical protein